MQPSWQGKPHIRMNDSMNDAWLLEDVDSKQHALTLPTLEISLLVECHGSNACMYATG